MLVLFVVWCGVGAPVQLEEIPRVVEEEPPHLLPPLLGEQGQLQGHQCRHLEQGAPAQPEVEAHLPVGRLTIRPSLLPSLHSSHHQEEEEVLEEEVEVEVLEEEVH